MAVDNLERFAPAPHIEHLLTGELQHPSEAELGISTLAWLAMEAYTRGETREEKGEDPIARHESLWLPGLTVVLGYHRSQEEDILTELELTDLGSNILKINLPIINDVQSNIIFSSSSRSRGLVRPILDVPDDTLDELQTLLAISAQTLLGQIEVDR